MVEDIPIKESKRRGEDDRLAALHPEMASAAEAAAEEELLLGGAAEPDLISRESDDPSEPEMSLMDLEAFREESSEAKQRAPRKKTAKARGDTPTDEASAIAYGLQEDDAEDETYDE